MKPTRRQILGTVLATGATSLLGCKDKTAGTPAAAKPPTAPVPADLRFFTAANYATAVALFERLFPGDEDPGATELGVAHYVDRALAGRYAEARDLIRDGLARLDHDSSGVAFHRLPPDRQDDLVRSLERSGDQTQVAFVQVSTALVLEGALADPIYRASHDTRGWSLVGFTPDECARPDSRRKR
jgi:hypothetical protein